ncbi:hypothetical protein [Novosphingopyxis sp.]|uniref:hypothetical protein n=1 Tax=Novosphingopyxis sp. TaxID=2709690 RepID=UPI003B59E963
MRTQYLLLAPTILAALGCQSLPQRQSGSQLAETSNQICTPVNAVDSIQLNAQPNGDAAKTIRAEPDAREQRFEIVEVIAVNGACAGNLQLYRMDNLLLANGSWVRRDAQNDVGPREPLSLEEDIINHDEPHPRASGRFVMAFRVGYRRANEALITDYVGVWQKGNAAVVSGYSSSPATGFTTPRAVFTSELPIRSVSYFPSPDTASGRLGVVQEQTGGSARMIGIDWAHQGFFNKLG